MCACCARGRTGSRGASPGGTGTRRPSAAASRRSARRHACSYTFLYRSTASARSPVGHRPGGRAAGATTGTSQGGSSSRASSIDGTRALVSASLAQLPLRHDQRRLPRVRPGGQGFLRACVAASWPRPLSRARRARASRARPSTSAAESEVGEGGLRALARVAIRDGSAIVGEGALPLAFELEAAPDEQARARARVRADPPRHRAGGAGRAAPLRAAGRGAATRRGRAAPARARPRRHRAGPRRRRPASAARPPRSPRKRPAGRGGARPA